MSSKCLILFIYLSLSIFWIFSSDRIALIISGDDHQLFEKIQAVKGLLFVFASAAVLFFISRRFYVDLHAKSLQQQEVQAKYNAMNEAAGEGFFDCDLTNMTARMNDRMKFFFPMNSNEVDDFWEKYQKRIHAGDIERLLKEFDAVVSSGKSNWLLEYRLMGSDNKYHHVISSVYIMRDLNTGEASRLIGAIQDVTELRNLQVESYEERLKHKQKMTASIIRAQENERERWAAELHDNVCQILGVAKLYLSEIRRDKNNIATLLPEADKLISGALEEIRQLSYHMKPPSFDRLGLVESIEMLVGNISRFKKIDFSMDAADFCEDRIAEDEKMLIYRVVQEQVNNIVKHAEAATISASLSIDSTDTVHITVRDDGKGFDMHKHGNGIGLRNMESRIHAHKGELFIQSAPGKGCTLQASFQLSAPVKSIAC